MLRLYRAKQIFPCTDMINGRPQQGERAQIREQLNKKFLKNERSRYTKRQVGEWKRLK